MNEKHRRRIIAGLHRKNREVDRPAVERGGVPV